MHTFSILTLDFTNLDGFIKQQWQQFSKNEKNWFFLGHHWNRLKENIETNKIKTIETKK